MSANSKKAAQLMSSFFYDLSTAKGHTHGYSTIKK